MGFYGRLLGTDKRVEFKQFELALKNAHASKNAFDTLVHGVHAVVRYFPTTKALSDDYKKDAGRRALSVKFGRLLELKQQALDPSVLHAHHLSLPVGVLGITVWTAAGITPKIIEQVKPQNVHVRTGNSNLSVAAWKTGSFDDIILKMTRDSVLGYNMGVLRPIHDLTVEIGKEL